MLIMEEKKQKKHSKHIVLLVLIFSTLFSVLFCFVSADCNRYVEIAKINPA